MIYVARAIHVNGTWAATAFSSTEQRAAQAALDLVRIYWPDSARTDWTVTTVPVGNSSN
jgi:hypothetical protein